MTQGFDVPLDLRAHAPGEWVVLRALTYTAASGRSYIVPRGFVTDLASIPRLLRPALDQNGASRRPAVLHDALYCRKSTTRQQADDLFYEALRAEGVGHLTALLMYAGVRAGGWLYWNKRDGLQADDFTELAP
ncbi:hypothetical protein D3C75_878980 [compost metagenome]